ncbi:MAG: prepilin-type N-terminal cleavage/methylation domain-containing protein [Candidatus Sumerlaeia bacterium]
MKKLNTNAFTLIELLIVVAIIAILAAIAVPNFLEAQTRAKVSRVKSDMRSLATAIESYSIDNNNYPINPFDDWENSHGHFTHFGWNLESFVSLTTPVAYITTVAMEDPFLQAAGAQYGDGKSFFFNNVRGADKYLTDSNQGTWSVWGYPSPAISPQKLVSPMPMKFNGPDGQVHMASWNMLSAGPDRNVRDTKLGTTNKSFPWAMLGEDWEWQTYTKGATVPYDPTNGTVSEGNIWRLSGGTTLPE